MKTRIHEIKNLKEFEKLKPTIVKPRETRFYLDIDQTVMTTRDKNKKKAGERGGLGGDVWFNLTMSKACEKLGQDEAVPLVVALYNNMQEIVKAQPVEPETVKIFNQLQDEAVVIPLTARGDILEKTTLRQLNGIDMHFKEPIIFCNGKKKGDVVIEDINKLKKLDKPIPKHIAAMDDRKHHATDIAEKVSYQLNIEHDVVRYGYLDNATIDMEQTNKEFAHVISYLPTNTKDILKRLGIKLEKVEPDPEVLKKYDLPALKPITSKTKIANSNDYANSQPSKYAKLDENSSLEERSLFRRR